ncbi:uncharacterized protein LOC144748775 [Ciona intestinalis]
MPAMNKTGKVREGALDYSQGAFSDISTTANLSGDKSEQKLEKKDNKFTPHQYRLMQEVEESGITHSSIIRFLRAKELRSEEQSKIKATKSTTSATDDGNTEAVSTSVREKNTQNILLALQNGASRISANHEAAETYNSSNPESLPNVNTVTTYQAEALVKYSTTATQTVLELETKSTQTENVNLEDTEFKR